MKRKTINILFIIAASLLLFSCVVKQDIYFKKDFSGSYKYTFDFKEYVDYMNAEEDDSLATKNGDFEEYLSVVKSELNQIDGISNLKIVNNAENGMVYFMYDFANITALNAAIKYSNYMETEPLANAPYFEQKKKTLIYIRHATPKEVPAEDGSEEDLSYMNEMFKWEFNIEFEADVKKYDVQKDTSITISSNKRSFTEFGSLFDVVTKESKWVFKTK